MVGDVGPSKQERIADVDRQVISPHERAQAVWKIIKEHAPDLTDWDVVCFAANYLGWQSANYSWLETPAKDICRLVYTAHYLVTEKTDVSSGINNRPPESDDSDNGKNESGERSRRFGGLDVSGGGFG